MQGVEQERFMLETTLKKFMIAGVIVEEVGGRVCGI
jgi:hypothetical protein